MNDRSDMVLVEGELFVMGNDESPNEAPRRTVQLSPYYIDRYPVTNSAFRQFIESDGYKIREFWTDLGWQFIQDRKLTCPLYWFDGHWNSDNQPVTGVSWWEASAFSRYVGKELPTEAQWECAARGSDGRLYPWGGAEPTPEHALYAVDCDPAELRRKSADVRAFPKGASPWGCMDMSGNLGEWCLDNASYDYAWDLTRFNPVHWFEEAADHVVRGGSGLHNEDYLRCSSRDYYPPTLRDNIVGFRCVINH